MQSHQRALGFTILLLAHLAACSTGVRVDRANADPERQALPLAPVPSYPPGRWRLADPHELERVVLWVSQIVIRHRERGNPDPAFAMADWHSESPGNERSRAEALALALEIRAQAAREPARFAELAERYSEDVASQPLHGALGGIPAYQLLMWPRVLDALAATPPGNISEVVETAYGFHILSRRAAPHEDTVTGAHIVISHDAAGWINVVGRGENPGRSRAEALALANQLYAKAKQKPDEFSALVEQFSEHRDASRAGDMGTWSTLEPTFFPREVAVLSGLAVGDVAPPLDSPVGFQIIRRLPNRPRDRFAMDQVRLFFDPSRFEPDPMAKGPVLALATELTRLLGEAPSQFAELQREYCCEYPEDWIDGRGTPALTNELSRLAVGQIAPSPIQAEFSYVIPRRINPPPRPPVVALYELPEPSAPDVQALIGARDATFLTTHMNAIGDEIAALSPWPELVTSHVANLHRDAKRFEGQRTPEQRIATFQALARDVEATTTEAGYPRYRELVDAHFERLLLGVKH